MSASLCQMGELHQLKFCQSDRNGLICKRGAKMSCFATDINGFLTFIGVSLKGQTFAVIVKNININTEWHRNN